MVDLGFLLTLIVLLGGGWIYLLDSILKMTVASPAEPVLRPLGLLHFVVLEYLVLALAVSFWRGLQHIGHEQPTALKYAARLLFGTWPVAVVTLVISLALTKVGILLDYKAFAVAFPLVGGLFALLVYMRVRGQVRRDATYREQLVQDLLTFPVVTMMLFLPYLAAMSIVLSDVEVETDKGFYTGGDMVASVRPAGYILTPRVTSLECGGFRRELPPEGGTFSIPLSAIGSTDYLVVAYQPQVTGGLHKHFTYIKIAQKLQ
jgi:hypothetical protein